MSDNLQNDNVIIEQRKPPDTTMPMVVYALYLASFVVGFTSVIGVVIAYVYRGKGPAWLDEHYRYQIRTFWIGLLYASVRSEEHTSELQSRPHLVCRLLLEKKNT